MSAGYKSSTHEQCVLLTGSESTVTQKKPGIEFIITKKYTVSDLTVTQKA